MPVPLAGFLFQEIAFVQGLGAGQVVPPDVRGQVVARVCALSLVGIPPVDSFANHLLGGMGLKAVDFFRLGTFSDNVAASDWTLPTFAQIQYGFCSVTVFEMVDDVTERAVGVYLAAKIAAVFALGGCPHFFAIFSNLRIFCPCLY